MPGSDDLRARGDQRPSATEWTSEDAAALRSLFLDEAEEHLRRLTEAHDVLGRVAGKDDAAAADAVDALFRALHTLKGAAGSVGMASIEETAHELEELCAEVRHGTLALLPGIVESLGEGVSTLRALVDGARLRPLRASPLTPRPLDPSPHDARPERRQTPERRFFDRRAPERTVRVDSERLDALVDGMADLVTLRTRLERRVRELEAVRRDLDGSRAGLHRSLDALARGTLAGPSPHDDARAATDRLGELELELATTLTYLDRSAQGLFEDVEALRRATDRLDEEVRRARLVPVDVVFQRVASTLRELESTAGRRAALVTDGGGLELDKAVVEQIGEPLLHLLRNALAHGVEPPDERTAAGKSPEGRISLTAKIEGEEVHLTFGDDGRGVDTARIYDTLVRQGRLPPATPLPQRALLDVLFEPGFSTRLEADALAGRGMGLNIVKTTVERLGGRVELSYEPGLGTSFSLRIPLTAAITEAFLFKVAGQVYAVPASSVVEALPGSSGELPTPAGGQLGARASAPPLLRLHALLGVEMPPDHRLHALLMRHGEHTFVVTCDRLIGPRTIVLRPLGPVLGALPYYAGVTISGAGKAQLVLDVSALCDAAQAGERGIASPRRVRARVLVVDDSRLAREAAALTIAGAGMSPVTAEDGFEAWELLGERRFDALVTDLEMPRVDGFELLARVRRDPTLKGLPIIVLSSRSAPTTRQRVLEAGADQVIPKTAQRRALVEALLSLIEVRDGGRRGS